MLQRQPVTTTPTHSNQRGHDERNKAMAFKNTGIMCMVTVNESFIDLGNYFTNEKTGERVLITTREKAKKYGRLVKVPIYVRKA